MENLWQLAPLGLVLLTISIYIHTNRPTYTLPGPPRGHLLFGQFFTLFWSPSSAIHLEEWASMYGGVFYRPGPFGSGDVVVMDPVAAAHVLQKGTTTYPTHVCQKAVIRELAGDGLGGAEGDTHFRRRRAIAPGFSHQKIREYVSMFYNSAYKLCARWEQNMPDTQVFDVDAHLWLSAFTIDCVGLAGFSHDFGALSGQPSALYLALKDMESITPSALDLFVLLLSLTSASNLLGYAPTALHRARERVASECAKLVRDMLPTAGLSHDGHSSVVECLVDPGRVQDESLRSVQAVVAQMRGILIAGHETTTATLVWVLIELCRRPDLQERVRSEIVGAWPQGDPPHEKLAASLPLLEAIIHETLRLHPAVPEIIQTASKDDSVPTSRFNSAGGQVIIPKGSRVVLPIMAINRSHTLWGDDAWEFRPERWMADLPPQAQEISGYRNLMTFIDGPRACIGRTFAMAKMRVLLTVLLRKYRFGLPGGPATPIDSINTIVVHPKVKGEPRCSVPMRVSKIAD